MTDTINLAVARAQRENDNSLMTPLDALKDAVREVESGERPATSVLIITLHEDDEAKTYDPGWYAARLKGTEMIALMEAVKAMLLREMGF